MQKRKIRNIKSCCTTEHKIYKKITMENGEVHIAIKCRKCDKFFVWARRTPRTMALVGIDNMSPTIPIPDHNKEILAVL